MDSLTGISIRKIIYILDLFSDTTDLEQSFFMNRLNTKPRKLLDIKSILMYSFKPSLHRMNEYLCCIYYWNPGYEEKQTKVIFRMVDSADYRTSVRIGEWLLYLRNVSTF